jgi:hypothetical protein
MGAFGGLKSMSTVIGVQSKKTMIEVIDDKSSDKRVSLKNDDKPSKEIKFAFKPISLIDFGKDGSIGTRRAELENLQPLNKGESTIEINTRSLINMDNEPTYFLQAFQGSMITKTNDYLKYEKLFIANEMDEETYVMMF